MAYMEACKICGTRLKTSVDRMPGIILVSGGTFFGSGLVKNLGHAVCALLLAEVDGDSGRMWTNLLGEHVVGDWGAEHADPGGDGAVGARDCEALNLTFYRFRSRH
jgi:hypothetical protein